MTKDARGNMFLAKVFKKVLSVAESYVRYPMIFQILYDKRAFSESKARNLISTSK